MKCQHLDTCALSALLNHHNREGELLIGVFVNGNTTHGDVRRELLDELTVASEAVDPTELSGFDLVLARQAAKALFADLHPMQLDRGLFDESLDLDDGLGNSDTIQAWFLFRWDYPTQTDENGHCVHCGRDNNGYEDQPCSDECPAYWEARGIPHPDYP
jgi:hypothetical protein